MTEEFVFQIIFSLRTAQRDRYGAKEWLNLIYNNAALFINYNVTPLSSSTGQALLNESDLAILILNMLIDICAFYPSREDDGGLFKIQCIKFDFSKSIVLWFSDHNRKLALSSGIIRPLPRAKRVLSENCLPHLVQLLLTFDPTIVEKVCQSLTSRRNDQIENEKIWICLFFNMVIRSIPTLFLFRLLYCWTV